MSRELSSSRSLGDAEYEHYYLPFSCRAYVVPKLFTYPSILY
jgi:hypothetical protein